MSYSFPEPAIFFPFPGTGKGFRRSLPQGPGERGSFFAFGLHIEYNPALYNHKAHARHQPVAAAGRLVSWVFHKVNRPIYAG